MLSGTANRGAQSVLRISVGGMTAENDHLNRLVAEGRMAADWAQALAPMSREFHAVGEFLSEERRRGAHVLPEKDRILTAYQRPMRDVRVLVVGQDPYPTPGHAIGLAFSAARNVRPLPRSLINIYRELEDDLSIPRASHGDLTAWADQGVLLLNRVLTVRAGETGSHRRKGWEPITEHTMRALVASPAPLVALLWGNDARALKPLLGDTPVVESAHPSPLSASRGFFGSRPFSRVNEALVSQGARPIDWSLEKSIPHSAAV